MLLWIPRELHVAHALAAFVALIGAILGIWILDCFGDKLRDFNKKGHEHHVTERSTEADDEVRPISSADSGIITEHIETVRESLIAGVDTVADGVDTVADGVVNGAVRAFQVFDQESHLHVEDALRNIIRSIAVFVGLSWEKAFDVAEHTVVDKVPWFSQHRVISKVLLALLLCFFTLPGWYRYILPKALMDQEAHKERINLELSQEEDHRNGRGKETKKHVTLDAAASAVYKKVGAVP